MTRLRGLVLLSVVVLAAALSSWGAVFVSVAIGPPALPVYAQPLCPGPGYIWTPGYWAWGPAGYFWVPGTWAIAPQVGFLWTPGFWAFSAGFYNWHPGYWGPRVGFYGGINYGFGYTGVGYWGGYWRGRDFYYNRTVNNINVTNIHNVYNQTVINNVTVNRVSYNGGPNGIQARPTSQQLAAEHDRHVAATAEQVQHEQAARSDRAQFASVNHGQPAVGATPRPGAFNAREATAARQPAMNSAAPNANTFNNIRQVPRPPQNYQPALASTNVARPPQSSFSQQRGSANVSRPPSHNQPAQAALNVPRPGNDTRPAAQQGRNVPRPATMQHAAPAPAARYANSGPRPAAPVYRTAARPSTQNMSQRPASQQQRAARPSTAGSGQGGHRAH